MDKKILLSVLIVALIGIVAATYQINSGQDILNPLSSVETEESPVTEALTAPQTDQQQQSQQQADAQAQQQIQAQQQQAQDKANAEAQAQQQEQQANESAQSSGSQTINSDNPLTISTSDSSSNTGASNTQAVADSNTNNQNQDQNTQNTQNTQNIELTSADIISILQDQLDKSNLVIDTDNYKFLDGTYQVKAYQKQTREYAGTFYIRPEDKSWYFIDKYGDTVGPDAPEV